MDEKGVLFEVADMVALVMISKMSMNTRDS